ncbi:hypothetical protein Tco_1326040 [Tanacetum coccineum]
MSSLEALIKQHNERTRIPIVTPICLTFHDNRDGGKGKDGGQSLRDEGDDDLKKPYKEVLKSPFTRRIIEFSAPSHRMPTNLKIYDGSTDPDDHINRFVGAANQREWEMPVWCRIFQQTLDGPARGCNLETVTEMMQRVDDFVKSEEAYKSKELLKGEQPERGMEHHSGVAGRLAWIMGTDTKRQKIMPEGTTTNRTQLEAALESRKLNHLVKDVKHMGNNRGRVVSSTVHAMVKFLTPIGIATLITRMAPVYECRWSEKRAVKHDEGIEVREPKEVKESREEKVLVNPTFLKQTVTIGT